MLVTLFKYITSILLIVALFFLIVHRDFYGTIKNSLNKNKPSAQDSSYSTKQPETSEITDEAQQEEIPIPTINEDGSHVKESTSTPKTDIVVIENTKNTSPTSVYEHLNEGTPDTDPQYRPAVSPCKKAMGFRIGTFDSRFGISKTQFIKEVEQSADIWSESVDKKLFYFDENGALTVNLIYDERQATTIDANYLALEIENTKKNAEALKSSYEQEKAIYTNDNTELTKDAENLQARYTLYGEKVSTYNKAGGASKIEYDTMMAEAAQLKQEAKLLEERRVSLLTYIDSINKKVTRYNEFVLYINSLIRKSNALGAAKFTEGKFTPYTNTIDIYQYNDSVKLRRVLTHELGHVLGINHVKNAQSIMYSYNSATTTILSKEDTDALLLVCPLQ